MKKMFLTFDGAPNSQGTPKILEILNKYQIQGTFFLEGKRLESNQQLAQEIIKAGHSIGNHSYSHTEFDKLELAECLAEVENTDNLIRNILGIKTRLIRPPAGKITEIEQKYLEKLGYIISLWNISIKDWLGPDAASIAARLVKELGKDEIISVMHDHVEWIPEVLDISIPYIKANGYEFLPMKM
ncbi:MAG: polysaccharide deacetylase family protein [Clostridia bacterium]